jgi:hypothetical protein
VAVGRPGEIYVADGYRKSRVLKFDREGKFLKAWGKYGTGEGEFNTGWSTHTNIPKNRKRSFRKAGRVASRRARGQDPPRANPLVTRSSLQLVFAGCANDVECL